MRRLVICSLAALGLVAPAVAGAHRIPYTSGELFNIQLDQENADCGRAVDWICRGSDGPNVFRVSKVGDHSWHVRAYYWEKRVSTSYLWRTCHTTSRITHSSGVVAHHKYCGRTRLYPTGRP